MFSPPHGVPIVHPDTKPKREWVSSNNGKYQPLEFSLGSPGMLCCHLNILMGRARARFGMAVPETKAVKPLFVHFLALMVNRCNVQFHR